MAYGVASHMKTNCYGYYYCKPPIFVWNYERRLSKQTSSGYMYVDHVPILLKKKRNVPKNTDTYAIYRNAFCYTYYVSTCVQGM